MSNSFWKGAPNSSVEMNELNKERITMEVIPFKLARDIISNPLERTSRNVGNVLLEQNPNKQLEILRLMQQLEQTGKIKNAYQNVLGGAAIRSGTNQINQLLNQ